MLFIWNFIVCDDSSWLDFILYSVSCRVSILLFLFPVCFPNKRLFSEIIEFPFELFLLKTSWICWNLNSWVNGKNHDSLVVSLASFQLENKNSVGEITSTNQRRPEDSEKYKYRARFPNLIRTEIINDFLFFRTFNSEPIFGLFFYNRNCPCILRYCDIH